MTEVGIEKLAVYPTTLALDMTDLCRARDIDPEHVRCDLMVDERGVNPPWEDPVTMAVNAAEPMLTPEDRDAIGLLIVATETGVDQEKPISSWVHGFLGLSPHCRNFEVKHACYGATGGVQLALNWLASGAASERKALVINTDQSLISRGAPYEPVTGAGAAAILLSRQPRLIAYELDSSGIYAADITDVFRPTPRIETGNSALSLLSYLEALAEAFDDYAATTPAAADLDSHFDWFVYHMPFAGMAYRAHRCLTTQTGACTKDQFPEHFKRKAEPAMRFSRRLGGVYGASTFVGLLGVAAQLAAVKSGDRVGIYAYGSGACAEFQSARFLPQAGAVAAESGLEALLAARRRLSVEEYDTVEDVRDRSIMAADYVPDLTVCDGLYEGHYAGRHRLVLEEVAGYYRTYGWS